MLISTEAVSLIAPGVEGTFGVLADHAPMMAELTIGVMSYKNIDEEELHYAISGGFIEIYSNEVKVFADTAESGDQIDIERAKAALKRAEERLKSIDDPDIDLIRAEAALHRAIVRLKAANKNM